MEKDTSNTFVVITEHQLADLINNAAKVAAKEAILTYEGQREKEQKNRSNRKLRNTKLLLRNYRMLKEHAENSVFTRIQMDESAFDILESMMMLRDDEVIVDSIKRSATRTAIMVSHVDAMLNLFKIYCESSSNSDIEVRRYEVLKDKYMEYPQLSVKEIAEKHNMSKENVYADLKYSEEKITALIFGVDGLKVH